jgi:hypothetical protein
MTLPNNQVGWYCGLQGPFANKSEALAIRQPAVKVGYKPPQAEAISYRVDKSIWKSPYLLVEKHRQAI